MRAARITKCVAVGSRRTMDIEVDSKDHVFYGDEIAVSNSHGVSYAMNAYTCAWYKANYTNEFFLACLYYAHEKQDPQQEIYELVSEAKLFNIEMKAPSLLHFSKKFEWHNGHIYFGIKDTKSLAGVSGDRVVQQMQDISSRIGRDCADFRWMDVLVHVSPSIGSIAFKTLASVGFFSTPTTGVSRNRAIYEYLIFERLTKTELEWVQKEYVVRKWATLKECLTDLYPTKKEGGGTHNKNRSILLKNEIDFIDNPPYDLEDDPAWIVDQEVRFFGCPVSLSRVDVVDTSSANTSCKDIVNGKTGDNICVVANVTRIGTYITKKGKSKGEPMAFLTIEDDSCSIDNAMIFPDALKEYKHIMYEGANLLFCGEVSKKDNSFIIKKIHEIS